LRSKWRFRTSTPPPDRNSEEKLFTNFARIKWINSFYLIRFYLLHFPNFRPKRSFCQHFPITKWVSIWTNFQLTGVKKVFTLNSALLLSTLFGRTLATFSCQVWYVGFNFVRQLKTKSFRSEEKNLVNCIIEMNKN
jgi:hypothetical protein